ncbi:unnamed protein product [Lactuca saligna]|uniref:Tetrahydrofolate dehydrogenase/cyclohydrolase catalytic domain-containing protein n=1 Tax=Lactuca saligna TaxID=75948 RepID=A0AA35VMJ4_LACSI|nr:unnamed protein product [Lactuca saligna]
MKATFDDSSFTNGPTSESPETEVFVDRLLQVCLRYRSGTGKKVYARNSKMSEMKSGRSSGSRANMFINSSFSSRMKDMIGIVPGLVVILVGDRKDSTTYGRNKKKACNFVGINSYDVRLAEDSAEEEFVNHISKFNDDPCVHGILVQLPLPRVLGLTTVTFSSKHDVSCFAPNINVPSQFMSNLIDDSSSSELLEGTQIQDLHNLLEIKLVDFRFHIHPSDLNYATFGLWVGRKWQERTMHEKWKVRSTPIISWVTPGI